MTSSPSTRQMSTGFSMSAWRPLQVGSSGTPMPWLTVLSRRHASPSATHQTVMSTPDLPCRQIVSCTQDVASNLPPQACSYILHLSSRNLCRSAYLGRPRPAFCPDLERPAQQTACLPWFASNLPCRHLVFCTRVSQAICLCSFRSVHHVHGHDWPMGTGLAAVLRAPTHKAGLPACLNGIYGTKVRLCTYSLAVHSF